MSRTGLHAAARSHRDHRLVGMLLPPRRARYEGESLGVTRAAHDGSGETVLLYSE